MAPALWSLGPWRNDRAPEVTDTELGKSVESEERVQPLAGETGLTLLLQERGERREPSWRLGIPHFKSLKPLFNGNSAKTFSLKKMSSLNII